jgi:hypothetical protein
MAKYKNGRAGIRGCENRTIQNPKLDSPISLSQASTSAAGSSFGKQSWTPPRQNSEGWDHRHQDHHHVPYLPAGPRMPRPWGPSPMMYPPCPPWVGWYGPWCHRQCTSTRDDPDLLRVLAMKATMQKMATTYTLATSRMGEPQDRKIGLSKMPNRTIWFPRK